MRDNIAYRPEEAAEVLGVSKRTLEEWRKEARGPAYVKQDRLILYPRKTLMSWLEKRLTWTSDQGPGDV